MKNNMKNIPALLLLLFGGLLKANNIQVASVTLNGKDLSAGANNAANSTFVQFDLSWENSWRVNNGSTNWDAAWVFIKYRVSGGTWQHAWLGNNGHTIPSGFTADAGLLSPGNTYNATTNPALGVFIYRSANGYGNNSLSGVKLRWNHGAQGLKDNDIVDVRVFAVEMVFIPQGSFYLGSGSSEDNSFTDGSWISGATIPFQITTDAALGIDNVAGKLWGTSSSIGNVPADAEATLDASFPKGFAAFYCMKYEISQGQYRDFLNTLTRTQQANRITMDGVVGRYAGGLTWNGSSWSASAVDNLTTPAQRIGLRLVADPGGSSPRTYACDLNTSSSLPSGVNQSDDGEWVVMGQINWMDVCSYLDWSGLRPMTELEYEKAARGFQYPTANEYAWGTTNSIAANNITNSGENNEVTNTAGANAVFGNNTNVRCPIRTGAFASANTNREQSGASYFGVMELTGNVYERSVTLGNAAGRSYRGNHGDGALFNDGSANVDYWPGINGNNSETTANTAFGGTTGVTFAAGAGFRGGGFLDAPAAVSYRATATDSFTGRKPDHGGRGVRSAP